jgi:hypothetical protein
MVGHDPGRRPAGLGHPADNDTMRRMEAPRQEANARSGRGPNGTKSAVGIVSVAMGGAPRDTMGQDSVAAGVPARAGIA